MKKKEKSFYSLLYSLLVVLLLYPAAEGRSIAGLVFALFFTWLLISSLLAISERKLHKTLFLIIFGIPSIALLWLDQYMDSHILRMAEFSFMIGILGWTIVSIMNYIMRAKKVTTDILAGAGSVYLLMGIFWGIVNGFLHSLNPSSFNVSETIKTSLYNNWAVFNYYSFTTLTTLGYGDITPLTSRAQSFAIIEASSGVLFSALLISRLVGMYISQNIERNIEQEGRTE